MTSIPDMHPHLSQELNTLEKQLREALEEAEKRLAHLENARTSARQQVELIRARIQQIGVMRDVFDFGREIRAEIPF